MHRTNPPDRRNKRKSISNQVWKDVIVWVDIWEIWKIDDHYSFRYCHDVVYLKPFENSPFSIATLLLFHISASFSCLLLALHTSFVIQFDFFFCFSVGSHWIFGDDFLFLRTIYPIHPCLYTSKSHFWLQKLLVDCSSVCFCFWVWIFFLFLLIKLLLLCFSLLVGLVPRRLSI